MKPVNNQRFPSLVPTNPPNGALLLKPRSPDANYCSKCGFSTMDNDLFKRHINDHMGSKLCCFYCQRVVFNRAEFNAHLEEHLKSTLKCPHCGQAYIRKLSLLKHIERVHSKNISQGPKKIGVNKDPQIYNALPGVQSAQRPTQPTVRLNVPSLNTPTVSLGKDVQKVRSMNKILPISSNGVSDGSIHQNRALTVALPEEISIPAGCLVELVEVKTVNGSKELKLRLVSRQEKEAEKKDMRTPVKQNITEGKTLAIKLNPPSRVKSTNMGMCVVNRKQMDTKKAVQCPTIKPVSMPNIPISSQASKEKLTLKRMSEDIIDLDSPAKVFKPVYNPVAEKKETPSSQSEPVYSRTKTYNVVSETSTLKCLGQPVKTGLHVSWQNTDEGLKTIPEHHKSISPTNTKIKESCLQDLLTLVKRSPGVVHLNDNTCSKVMDTPKVINTPAYASQQIHKPSSLKLPSGGAVKVLPPKVHLHKESVPPHSALPSQVTAQTTVSSTSSLKMQVASFHPKSNSPTWSQGVQPRKEASERETPKPEGFPVISSVFSLSEEPENTQGAMQPLVMALRGIVMDKSNTADKSMPNVSYKDQFQTNHTCSSVKIEEKEEVTQQHPIPVLNHMEHVVKMEKNSSTQTDNCSNTANMKSEDAQNLLDPAAVADINCQYDINKYLTVPLTRVDDVRMGSRNSSKTPALQSDTPIHVHSVHEPRNDFTVHLMPYKAEQLVMCPSPNQPVVVLNHPKPRLSMQDTFDTVGYAGTPAKAPKCQILKMRLGKLMGQKYEVTGCTVRFSQ
ncbi:uncharacterized protein LOC130924034 [Corythoichthys intestinalis]|uniref:uncharacterized protein LOC130924034 n=1 Tax=Corythoichthys intestinalis TaxID=161448 RepID=UPI0025A4F2AE|nr:uncharacterized protein LOC130924034 [Corythoichthys intestinalis]XP_057706318.1 uncharacterized protein LOC130924034 [Corythoichthys intestinalis]XP_057706319.1 uncharacterized protein LOC130924034 [Corythoichthys intestinalis]